MQAENRFDRRIILKIWNIQEWGCFDPILNMSYCEFENVSVQVWNSLVIYNIMSGQHLKSIVRFATIEIQRILLKMNLIQKIRSSKK